MRQIFGTDVYDEIAILKGLGYRQGDHPEGATKKGVGRVGRNADHAETDLDRTTDSAVEDGRIDLRVHSQNSAFKWKRFPTGMSLLYLDIAAKLRNFDEKSTVYLVRR